MSFATRLEFFAPCPRGLEGALAVELGELSALAADPTFAVQAPAPGGVPFSGAWAAAIAANLHSRIASRILLKIATRPYRDEHDIYALAREQSWEQWFDASRTLRVDVTAIKSPLRSLEFTTLRIKDAICDRLREQTGARPSIDTAEPDVRVQAFVTATDCTLYLDTSGEPLFKRRWRLDKGAAPLRENLAAGILRLTGWTPGTPLVDPMCGSGTFIAEAAQIALGIAPGVDRRFGFENLTHYDVGAWQRLKAQALDAKREAGARAAPGDALSIYGSDVSGDMLAKAAANLQRAGAPMVPLKQLDARDIVAPCDTPGVLVANPPYGERIATRGRGARTVDGDGTGFQRARPDDADSAFFRSFGDVLKQRFPGWHAFVLSADRTLPGQMRLRESTKTPLYNGALECRLFRFDLVAGAMRQRSAARPQTGSPD
ncbi:class I SAM-dependent RNA methyltransferase [Mycetohabitans rhizoxinica]|uniref:THUMP domain-containing class I SAM-dependent RNA methyltransferase n=1 Tax=Mycetohabitans rhizoxinica TaxID=412963 RepID=UPI0030D28049